LRCRALHATLPRVSTSLRHAARHAAGDALELYAVTAPGLEPVCREELAGLDIAGGIEDGGVAWRGDLASLYRANLECRTASRVVGRIGTFSARTFAELERHAARLPWDRFIPPGAALSLRVTARKSKLYHTGAVAERLAGVLGTLLAAQASAPSTAQAADDDEPAADAQLVVVRLFRDACTISADASGALLHQRGYRQALAKAPLRETIAAAMLLATGWRGDSPLVDPLCGSGTIPIEAALLARRIAPGLARPDLQPRAYAFEQWPVHDAALWRRVVDAARTRVLPAATARIEGSDAHGGAIAASRANAERAGADGDVTFERRPLAAFAPAAAAGHIVTNPPYGVRIGERRELQSLYAALGQAARDTGWDLAYLSADPAADAAVGVPTREVFATRNGGIPVRLMAAPAG
jgi:putative N6-adenine-specific DNA methylase